jgi:hypothetical protein
MVSGRLWIPFLIENNLKKVNRFTQCLLDDPLRKG